MKAFLIYILPIALVLVVFVNLFVGEPKFDTLAEEELHLRITQDVDKQEEFYSQQILRDTFNIYYHFNFINSHFRQDNEVKKDLGENIGRAEDSILLFYNNFTYVSSFQAFDLGHFGMGMCYYKIGKFDDALRNFKLIKNVDLPYLHYMYGNLYLNSDSVRAEEEFKKEIANEGFADGAYRGLAELYRNNSDSLYALCKNEEAAQYIALPIKRKVFYQQGDVIYYTATVFSRFTEAFNVYGFGAALLILLIWIVYLIKLDFYQRENVSLVLITLILGMFFAFTVSYFSDALKYDFSFSLNGEVFNDLMYCIFGIGFLEEIVKIIPFLLLLRFSKVVKEPIDYVIYASLSALGFAFVENIFYFDYTGFHKILGRALSAVIFHMFNSSLIAYGLVLGKNIKKYNSKVAFTLCLLIASVFHGLYDFILINNVVNSFAFLTFFQLLVSMFLWSSIINNCLNNSSKFESSEYYNSKELNDYLLYALSFVFLFEYMVVAIQYGAANANKTLIGDLLQGSFLLVFLTFSLSRFDVIRNYWAPLSFWDWSTFVDMHRAKPLYFNWKEILNRKVVLTSFRESSVLNDKLPIEGVILQRELISWEKDWYLVKLEKPLKVGLLNSDLVLVKLKYTSDMILSKPSQIVNLRMVNDASLLSEKRKNKRDFPFLDYATLSAV